MLIRTNRYSAANVVSDRILKNRHAEKDTHTYVYTQCKKIGEIRANFRTGGFFARGRLATGQG